MQRRRRALHDLARRFVEIRIQIGGRIEIRREVRSDGALACATRVELSPKIERRVVHRLAVAVDRTARVGDEVPRARRTIAPGAIEFLDRNIECIGHDQRDAGVRVRAEIAGPDRDVNLAGLVHPDEAVRRVPSAVLLAEAHADAATHVSLSSSTGAATCST